MPLRDILRGITTVGYVTQEFLGPTVTRLPAPIQSAVRLALAAIEDAGARAVIPRVDLAEITRASAFLRGSDKDRRSAEALVNALAYGWERLLSNSSSTHLLFSETVTAGSLAARVPAAVGTPYERAAIILAELRRAHVLGRLPGFPLAVSESEQGRIDQTLVAIFVWLLADRAPSFAEEESLLRWAFALAHSHQKEVVASFARVNLLAGHLQSLSEHL